MQMSLYCSKQQETTLRRLCDYTFAFLHITFKLALVKIGGTEFGEVVVHNEDGGRSSVMQPNLAAHGAEEG